MKAELYKRLFRAIFSEDIISLKKIAMSIMQEEQKLGHSNLAEALEKISISEKPITPYRNGSFTGSEFSSLPTSKRNNNPLVSIIPRSQLKHHMVLAPQIEDRLRAIENEYAARERLSKYNLYPKRKILLYGASGCGKTLSAERIAWNLGLPLLKVRFDSLISSYFGESASNLRQVFEYCKREPVVLLLDECDFIAKSRITNQDIGEVPRIVNMLLTLLDEYDAPGLIIATTNLKVALDEALFRRFDDVIEIPPPSLAEVKRILEMTFSAITVAQDVNLNNVAKKLCNTSAANIVSIAQNAAKYSILDGLKGVNQAHIERAINEMTKY